MLIKALVQFIGEDKGKIFSVRSGDIKDIGEKAAESFISAGYAEKVPEADEEIPDDDKKETDGDHDKAVGNNGRKSKKGSQN